MFYTPNGVVNSGVLLISGKTILDVGSKDQIRIPKNANIIDANEKPVIPGLIDLKIHGAMGYDAMGTGLAEIIKLLPSHGVTSFMAGTLINARDSIIDGVKIMAEIIESPPLGANCLGIHLEGPYLSRKRSGIANLEYLYPLSMPDFEEIQKFAKKQIKLVTFAPEDGHAMECIPELLKLGVEPVIGHSDASFDQVKSAVELGLRHSAHVFNAMRPFQHREPGVVGAIMYFDQLYAELIADGVHIHPAVFEILIRIKGLEKIILISDAYRFAGLPDGEYHWGEMVVHISKSRCELSDGSFMGSHAFLDAGVRNLAKFANIPFEKAIASATSNPAKSIGAKNKGFLASGYDADLVLLDSQLKPMLTIVGGETVWSK